MGQAGLCPARSGSPDPPEREWKNLGVGTDARMEGEQEGRRNPSANETAAENRRGQDRNRSFFDALAQIVQGKAQFRVFFHIGHDLIVGADHGGIVPAAEMLADGL